MLSALPTTILNTPTMAPMADTAARSPAEAGAGFAELMQRQADQRLADQRAQTAQTAQTTQGNPATHGAAPAPAPAPSNAERSASSHDPVRDDGAGTDAGSGTPTQRSMATGTTQAHAAEASAPDAANPGTPAGGRRTRAAQDADTAARSAAAALSRHRHPGDGTLPAANDTAVTTAPGLPDAAVAARPVAEDTATTPAPAASGAPDVSQVQPWLQAQALIAGWQAASPTAATTAATTATNAGEPGTAAAGLPGGDRVADLSRAGSARLGATAAGTEATTAARAAGPTSTVAHAGAARPQGTLVGPISDPLTDPSASPGEALPLAPPAAANTTPAARPVADALERTPAQTERSATTAGRQDTLALAAATSPAGGPQRGAARATGVATAASLSGVATPGGDATAGAVADTTVDPRPVARDAAVPTNGTDPQSAAAQAAAHAAAQAAALVASQASPPNPPAARVDGTPTDDTAGDTEGVVRRGGPGRAHPGTALTTDAASRTGPGDTVAATGRSRASDDGANDGHNRGGDAAAQARAEASPQAQPTTPPPAWVTAAAAAARHDSAAGMAAQVTQQDTAPTPAALAATAQAGPVTAAPAPATTGPANASPGATAAEARIPVPMDSPAFAPALGAQVSLFARDGVQTARLELNPAEMGPISVQIAIDGGAARVDFQAERAATRDAIEASLPALAGALQDAGLTLSGGGVFQHQPGRQQQPEPGAPASGQRADGRRDGLAEGGDTTATLAGAAPRARSRGLVDLVA